MNKELKSRILTFLWGAGYMVLAMGIDFVIQNISEFNIPDAYVVLVGLILAQISKFIKNQIELNGTKS